MRALRILGYLGFAVMVILIGYEIAAAVDGVRQMIENVHKETRSVP